jgi:hypothetical protein
MSGGAPEGNQNAKKAKIVEGGLRRALARDDWKLFNDGCLKIAEAFGRGEAWAASFVAERVDGRVSQPVELGVDSTGVEAISIFTAFVSEALTRAADANVKEVDAGGLVLPVEVRPTTH